MTVTPHRAAAVARRQLLRDRFAELLETWGDRYPTEHATQLLDAVDDLGFALPPGIDDPPPPPSHSTREGRERAKQLLAKALADRHTTDTS